jgi:hypothetical protein
LFTRLVDSIRKLLQSKVVLAHPEAPEDTRILNLFRNRAELKKALGDVSDEMHRLKDRGKLQEAATARVREQMERLESRLAAPIPGLQSLVHYQLRDLWMAGNAQIAAILKEAARQREDNERKQFLAQMNKQVFAEQQIVKQDLIDAEQAFVDVRSELTAVQAQLVVASGWWKFFKRRELTGQLHSISARARLAEESANRIRAALREIEENGGVTFPGLSRNARRMLNLTAIATAHMLAIRLAAPELLKRAADAVARNEPPNDTAQNATVCVALMQEIVRAKTTLQQSGSVVLGALPVLVDRLAAGAKFARETDTVPVAASVQPILQAVTKQAEPLSWDVLEQDLWRVSDLFHA